VCIIIIIIRKGWVKGVGGREGGIEREAEEAIERDIERVTGEIEGGIEAEGLPGGEYTGES
jgi:hypothetical protein